jgi:hypothetical protein
MHQAWLQVPCTSKGKNQDEETEEEVINYFIIGGSVLFLIIIGWVVCFGGPKKEVAEPKTRYGLPTSQFNELSWPAQQVIIAYNSLPADSKTGEDLYPVLKALDLKHGKNNLNVLCGLGDGAWRNEWPYYVKHLGRGGILTEYYNMYKAIEAIKDAKKAQDRALEIAGVQSDLDQVKDITARLRAEAQLIKDVTKDMT